MNKIFEYALRIDFSDCDPAGIIFFANLQRKAHTAYELFMKDISPERDFFADREFVLPIINAESKFYLPLKAGDEISVLLSVSILKDSSFELHYKFKKGGKLTAEVKTVHVCVDKKSFVKTGLPENLRDALKLFLSE